MSRLLLVLGIVAMVTAPIWAPPLETAARASEGEGERRELTETCSANLVLEIDGRRLTPHLSSGLLPGTYRSHLLERGEIEEEILLLDTVERASGLFLINSVRRWCEIRLLRGPL